MPKPLNALLSSMDNIVFELSWSPKTETAKLYSLSYNDEPVSLPPDASNRGTIRIQFPAPRTDTHRFQWSLHFPGKTLKKLKAMARIGDDEPVELGEGTEEKKGRWQGNEEVDL
jgi:hypothetical protein